MTFRPVTEPLDVGIARQRGVFEALALLTPHDLPQEKKIRIGGAGDGGYVLVDRLRPGQPVMSFGIGPSVSFDLDLAQRGHPVLLFDHTIARLPEEHAGFIWFAEGVAGAADPAQKLHTLADHMAKLPPGADAPILKMDIEGAEWDVLTETSILLMRRFEQIVLELHNLTMLDDTRFRGLAWRALASLSSAFTLCHVHANNFGKIENVSGFPVPETLEVTYIRSDLVQAAPSFTYYPTPLDTGNCLDWPDLPLWFYPFMPTSVKPSFPW
ncbi:FkbM family methyltransferase [Acidisoma cellulosilytica]|uniref:FkbM family methyltransferase n=1 Tax=Acidisoma cellulosilyticum TaxID=2802395 RepID=A0A963Z7F6_9PROT|nr:hypothetical protein [Acidisoma cellulosilyticum]MCB8883257.1 FkbM family methyltransferase [Acidisoma cellulosilyticum]